MARAACSPPDAHSPPGAIDDARFKRPRRYVRIDSLPKNNYGKVLKTALRERLAALSPPG